MNSDKLEHGLNLLATEREIEAFEILMPLAQEGILKAQAAIGLMYYLGQGVSRQLGEAVKWLQLAAEQGSGEAAHNLGSLYLGCEPYMPKDEVESKKWYQRAKELGFVVAPDDWYE